MFPRLALKRLVVSRGQHIAYDQRFHDGINVIHSSDNSCGKSTIMDFIFYVLGGNLKEFKGYAKLCDFVYGEFLVNDAVVTMRRAIADVAPPIDILLDTYENAIKTKLHDWQHCPLARQEKHMSFSQIIFTALGMPEIKGDEGSNITMHQVLRILYVDQMTPVHRMFRTEDFDPPIRREAVGNLLCGIGGYELFEKQLALRSLDKEYGEITLELRAMLKAANAQNIDADFDTIQTRINELIEKRSGIYKNIQLVPDEDTKTQTKKSQNARKAAADELAALREKFNNLEQQKKTLEYEAEDTKSYLAFLKGTLQQLDQTVVASEHLGNLKFEFCPACFTALKPTAEKACYLCCQEFDHGSTATRLVQIKLDTNMQLRDSLRIQKDRFKDLNKLNVAIQQLVREYKTKSQQLNELSVMPDKQSEIAKMNQEIGYINGQIEVFGRDLELVKKIKELTDKKNGLNEQLTKLKEEIEKIEFQQQKRRSVVYNLVSTRGLSILQKDPWQPEFGTARFLDFSFEKDLMSLDGDSNFSASSNVVLKNSLMLGLLEASLQDPKFYLPRFMLMDNVEDKGMKEERSQNFQDLMLLVSQASKTPHQIIYTTSMISPKLNTDEFVIGGEYSRERKTLNIQR